ncbi:MAG: tetraacyldisaccharide 4'-kinase, partial [Flavobacteriales bacterium]|nr:tetraacyldisaccharide 4'-kinase [Flavobacteriales bacterium]
ILFPFSLIYGGITSFRNFLFNINVMKGTQFDLPIVSIGNLTTGGTGKSPHTEYLIRLLKEEHQVATLSRGYGRSVSGFKLVDAQSTVRDCGDEPLQFKSKFPEIAVAVDKDRVNGVIEIIKDQPQIDCILLDDAFQHRGIVPSFNILLTEYSKPFYRDWMLPTGNLREWSIGKKRANMVIVTKCPSEISEANRLKMIGKMKLNARQTVYFSTFKYGQIMAINGNELFSSLDELKSKKIILVTGIANPQPLITKMNQEGLDFQHLRFPDHHRFSDNDIVKIQNLFDTFDADKLILTTEKDAQRLKSISKVSNMPFYYLQIEVAFLTDEPSFKTEITEHVRNYKSNS